MSKRSNTAAKKATKKTTKAAPTRVKLATPPPPAPTRAALDDRYFGHDRHFAPVYSMDMDPELVDLAFGELDTTTATRTREAAKSIADRVRSLDTVRASHGSGEASPRERFMSVMAIHRKAAKGIEEMINSAGRALAEDMNKLRADFLTELAGMNQRPSVTASELRAIAAQRDQATVEGFIRAAIEGGDGFVVDALLSTPAYMINLSQEAHDTLMEDAMRELSPTIFATREILREGMEALQHQASAALARLALQDDDHIRYEAEVAADEAQAAARKALDAAGGKA